MKAIVRTRYGSPDVLQLKEVEQPVPNDGQVLVKVHAASLNLGDRHQLRSRPLLIRILTGNGLFRPKDPRLGADLAGRVEVVGRNVTQFQVGDEVFGTALGAFAEYVCAREDRLAPKPTNLSFEAAAAVPIAALTALQGLREQGQIQSGQAVLINGASGGVGTFAVQIAKSFGAEVTGVCSTRNVDMVRSIGADHVIDYTQEDFTDGGQRFDLIFETAGSHSPSEIRRALTSEGTLVLIGHGGSEGRWIGPFGRMIRALVLSRFVSQRMVSYIGKPNYSSGPNEGDLATLRELIESGRITPVIDRTYSLSETPEAIRYLEEGHTRGKVVITASGEGA
jgi:NADPH:quinone reductase-like Zn-dependent oxidoreductase